MKNCEVCGTFNFKENNYCTHCGCRIVEDNICPFCGHKNPDANNVCIKCNRPITPVAIDSLDELFSENNLALVLNANISHDDYENILNNIFKKLDYVNITGNTPKEKVLKIANVFTKVIPKSSGIVRGEYGSMIIFYDDRLDDSYQISTIIHELAHFLLFDITVNMLCEILNVKSSAAIRCFADYFLTLADIEVINEFYAHSVENRFIPLKYQGFNSFLRCVSNLNMDAEDMIFAIKMANPFAYEVIHFLQKYIDEDLRESIKLQFKMDMVESEKIEHDFPNATFDPDEKIVLFLSLIASSFEELYNNKKARKELEYKIVVFED